MLHRRYDPRNVIRGTAGVALTAGDLVTVNASGLIVRAQGNSASTVALGVVIENVPVNGSVTAYRVLLREDLSGLTPGHRVFLSPTTAGGYITGADASSITTAGHIIQPVGIVLSPTTILFDLTNLFYLTRQASGSTTIAFA